MPYTKLSRPPHFEMGVLIRGTMDTLGIGAPEAARMMNCSTSTAQRRLRDLGSLTLDELTALGRGLHIPIDDLRGAIRY